MPEDVKSAVSSAVASARAELSGGGGEETHTDPDPETTATGGKDEGEGTGGEDAKGEGKSEGKSEDDDEEFFNPTAEELEAIQKDPKLLKVYKSMQRGMTKKATELKAKAKDLADRAALADWVSADPARAARALAQATGIPLKEVQEELAEGKQDGDSASTIARTLEAKWSETVGPDAAKVLRPLFEETAKAMFESMAGPLRQRTEELSQAAAVRGISASVREFGAYIQERGDPWDDDIQAEMAALSKRIAPGEDTPVGEYLDTLYNNVQARRAREKRTRDSVDKLKKLRSEQEPTHSGRPTPESKLERVKPGLKPKEAVSLAVKLAREELAKRR